MRRSGLKYTRTGTAAVPPRDIRLVLLLQFSAHVVTPFLVVTLALWRGPWNGAGWHNLVQMFHLLVSALVFLSILFPWLPMNWKTARFLHPLSSLLSTPGDRTLTRARSGSGSAEAETHASPVDGCAGRRARISQMRPLRCTSARRLDAIGRTCHDGRHYSLNYLHADLLEPPHARHPRHLPLFRPRDARIAHSPLVRVQSDRPVEVRRTERGRCRARF
jgi:hypothetical protein